MNMPYPQNQMNPYGNSYGNSYGTMYGNSYGQPMYAQQQIPMPQSYAPMPAQMRDSGIDWVDGEAAARAARLAPGETQHAMWDINEPIIYIKSVNQMGMPNPLQKVRYRMEGQEPNGGEMRKLESGDEKPEEKHSMEGYVRKEELDAMKEELKNAIREMQQGSGQTEQKGVRSNGKSAV